MIFTKKVIVENIHKMKSLAEKLIHIIRFFLTCAKNSKKSSHISNPNCSCKGVHFSVILSSFGAFAILQTSLAAWVMGELCLPSCGRDRYLMVLLAVFSFAGQILLTMALQTEQAGPVSIARSADVVFAFIWQVCYSKNLIFILYS